VSHLRGVLAAEADMSAADDHDICSIGLTDYTEGSFDGGCRLMGATTTRGGGGGGGGGGGSMAGCAGGARRQGERGGSSRLQLEKTRTACTHALQKPSEMCGVFRQQAVQPQDLQVLALDSA